MKHLFLKLALFLGIALVLATLLQIIVTFRVKDYNIGGNQTLHLENVNADLVFLGSSRAWVHFDPIFFEKSYGVKSVNLGVSGHSEIELATLRLENYLSKNRVPKFAVFNFDPMASADSLNTRNNFVLKDAFARYVFLPDARDEPLLDFFKFDFSEKYIPAYGILKYKGLKSHLFPKGGDYYTQFGYERNDEVWDTIKNPVTGLTKKHFYPDTDIPPITRALQKLHNLCKKYHIKLLCVQTPVYKSIYDPHYFSRNKAICEKLKIKFLDMESPMFRNEIEYFYNSNHLNLKGVQRMNVQFLKSPEMRSFLGS